MKLRLSPRAEADLDAIATYLVARDPRAARQVEIQIATALRMLLDHPDSGRHVGHGLRRLAVPRLPYVIFYRINEQAGAVAIATIRHTSRRPIA